MIRYAIIYHMLYPILFGGSVHVFPSTIVLRKGDICIKVTGGEVTTIEALKPFKFMYGGQQHQVRRGRAIQIDVHNVIFFVHPHHKHTTELRVLQPLPKYTVQDSPWDWPSLNTYVTALPQNLRDRVTREAFRAICKTKKHQTNFQKWVFTFCMSSHTRLGENSPWTNLPVEVGQMIRDSL